MIKARITRHLWGPVSFICSTNDGVEDYDNDEGFLEFRHVQASTRLLYDAPVPLWPSSLDVYEMQTGDPLKLSDHFTIQFLVYRKPHILQIRSFKRQNYSTWSKYKHMSLPPEMKNNPSSS